MNLRQPIMVMNRMTMTKAHKKDSRVQQCAALFVKLLGDSIAYTNEDEKNNLLNTLYNCSSTNTMADLASVVSLLPCCMVSRAGGRAAWMPWSADVVLT